MRLQDWKADAMEYRDADRAAQQKAEKRLATQEKARRYVRSLRNMEKREYARRYFEWRDGRLEGFDLPGGPHDERVPYGRLSSMAAQIDTIFDEEASAAR